MTDDKADIEMSDTPDMAPSETDDDGTPNPMPIMQSAVVKSHQPPHVDANSNGECVSMKVQHSQSSPSSLVEDSGTESGEDLRLLNPELLAEVHGALSKLECALPTLDTTRRASIIPLVTKLQSCLKVNENASSLSSKKSGSRSHHQSPQQPRKNYPIVGVCKQELDVAQRWLIENCDNQDEPLFSIFTPPTLSRQNSSGSVHIKFDNNKAYKPVKFTPGLPKDANGNASSNNWPKFPIDRKMYEKPKCEQILVSYPQYPKVALTSCSNPVPFVTPAQKYPENLQQQRNQHCTSDEGDISSTEEESLKTELKGVYSSSSAGYGSQLQESFRKIPARFHKLNKKMKMKRANTIDIPKLVSCEQVASSGEESVSRSADELGKYTTGEQNQVDVQTGPRPFLEVRTDKDRKFAQLLQKTKQEDLQSKTVSYNPNAARSAGSQWRNRFSHIKTAFEQGHQSPSPEDMSKAFKPIRKVASFPKSSSAKSENTFSHDSRSPFKPVSKGGALPHSLTSHSTWIHHPQPYSRVKVYHAKSELRPSPPLHHLHHTPHPLEFHNTQPYRVRQTCHSESELEPESIPAHKSYYPVHHKSKGSNTRQCCDYQNHQSSYPYSHYIDHISYSSYPQSKPVYRDSPYHYNMGQIHHYHTHPIPKPPYILPDPHMNNLNIPNPISNSSSFSSQSASPAAHAVSPTYQHHPSYYSLPTSPQPQRRHDFLVQPPQPCWKPNLDFYEAQPAHSQIMGKPQQAVVTSTVPNHPEKLPKKSFIKDFVSSTFSKGPLVEPIKSSTYQKLAKKSPELKNFAQTVPRAPVLVPGPKPDSINPIRPKPVPQKRHTTHISYIGNEPRTPPLPRKQPVKLVDDDDEMPEQFFVQNRRNKFEVLSANSGAQPVVTLPPQINEKAFFKPVPKRRSSPPVIVQQNRSPPKSPVQMPSVLQKSESWHQMIMERMKQSKPPSPIKPKIPKAKSTHNLATIPKQFEGTLNPDTIKIKQQTIEQYLKNDKPTSGGKDAKVASPRPARKICKLNEDFKCVDEAFDILFHEASLKTC